MTLVDRRIRVAFVIGEYPPAERKRREDAALAYSSPEVEVGIVSVKATPHYIGNAPDLLGLAVPPFIDAFREAEKQGYDAVVPLGHVGPGRRCRPFRRRHSGGRPERVDAAHCIHAGPDASVS